MIGSGTLLNAATVIAGSLIGMLIHSRLQQKYVNIVFQGIGLFTVALGVFMSLKSENMLLVVVSLVVGAIIGEWIGIDEYLRRFSSFLQRKTGGGSTPPKADSEEHEEIPESAAGLNSGGTAANSVSGSDANPAPAMSSHPHNRFTEGFITASMLFCVGSMAILGAIEDGMGETPNLLITKSIMDGISSIALASSFGVSILFSAFPILIYQGGLTLFAAFVVRFMSDTMIADMTGVGGILLLGLGINILKIKDISVINMLPSLVVIVVLSYFWG